MIEAGTLSCCLSARRFRTRHHVSGAPAYTQRRANTHAPAFSRIKRATAADINTVALSAACRRFGAKAEGRTRQLPALLAEARNKFALWGNAPCHLGAYQTEACRERADATFPLSREQG